MKCIGRLCYEDDGTHEVGTSPVGHFVLWTLSAAFATGGECSSDVNGSPIISGALSRLSVVLGMLLEWEWRVGICVRVFYSLSFVASPVTEGFSLELFLDFLSTCQQFQDSSKIVINF